MNIFQILAEIRGAIADGADRAFGFPLRKVTDGQTLYGFRILDRKGNVHFEATLKPQEYGQATCYWLTLQTPCGAQHKGRET